ncbi:hypothetical protein [Nocardioides pyridinolyticus]
MLGYSDFDDLPVVYDLAGQTVRRSEVTAPFAAEELRVGTTGRVRESVSVLGTSGRDVVVTDACRSEVRGAGGLDVLEVRSEQCEGVATTLRGEGGDDVLRGGPEDDVLLGGGGRDRALGYDGFDRCRAEVERDCESG